MTELSSAARDAIAKVEKLLNMARHPNTPETEAAVALDMAHKILEQHNLDMALVERQAGKGTHAKREDKTSGGGLYKWQRAVWEATARLNMCHYVSIKGMHKGSKYENRLIGRAENVLMTKIMAEYLQDAIERYSRAWAEGEGYNIFARDAVIYREGMAERIGERLEKLRRERVAEEKRKQDEYRAANPSSGTALVLADVIRTEADLNQDHIRGVEPGTTARERAATETWWKEYQEKQRAVQRDHEDKLLNDAAYSAQWQKDQLKAAKEQARRNKRSRSASYRSSWNESDRRRSSSTFAAGHRKGDEVGLDA